MKRLVCCFLVLIFFGSCQREKQNPQPETKTRIKTDHHLSNLNSEATEDIFIITGQRAKVKFKHTPVTKPGGPPAGSCSAPLGFCITRGIESVSPDYLNSQEERFERIGLASLVRIGNKLKFIPDMEFALEDRTVKLDSDYLMPVEFAQELNLESITLQEGTYLVDFTDGDFGSVSIDFE